MAKKDGILIQIVFSQVLVGSLESSDASHFSISFYVPEYAPDGSLVQQTRAPSSVTKEGTDSIILHFNSGNVNGFQNAVGDITIAYDGAGSIHGIGGYVSAFTYTFTPEDLEMKPNQHMTDSISINIGASSTLTAITWRYGFDTENISVDISAVGTLTRVEDL